MDKKDIQKVKETLNDFFKKMTVELDDIDISDKSVEDQKNEKESIIVSVKSKDPQILIGERGQTLFEIQKLLRLLLNKKIQKIFYLDLDINDYKRKKIEYLKDISKELADRVALTKEPKELFPMSAYERRIIHSELAEREDVSTESVGAGEDRYIIIKPK